MIKKLRKAVFITCLLFSGLANAQDGFIGEIKMFGGNFAPRDWAFCNGQLLPISENTALFSILGTTYGGDGTTTFGLPDLRGRVAVSSGQGPGLTDRRLGSMGGTQTNALTVAQMPSHNHSVGAVTANGNVASPSGNLLAHTGGFDFEYSNGNADTTMKSNMVGNTGSNQSVNNMQPYTTVNYIICLFGIYPARN
jgi:microcystin-dependent protein